MLVSVNRPDQFSLLAATIQVFVAYKARYCLNACCLSRSQLALSEPLEPWTGKTEPTGMYIRRVRVSKVMDAAGFSLISVEEKYENH